MRERTIEINETTDQLLTQLGSWITLTGTYTAETEGIDIVTNRTGVTIDKKSSTYTNSSTCKFLSASTQGKIGTEIHGEDKTVNEFLETINSDNVITATFKTGWNIKETEVFEEGNKPSLYVINYNPARGNDAFEEFSATAKIGSIYKESKAYPTISYRLGDTATSPTETKDITTGIMKVSKISIASFPQNLSKISFYKKGETQPFWVATGASIYIASEEDNISEYYAELEYATDTFLGEDYWETEWKIDVNDLKQALDLTDENIKNIYEITRQQFGVYNGRDYTTYFKGIAHVNNPDLAYDKVSYAELSIGDRIGDFNTNNTNFNKENKTIKIKMYKNTDLFRGTQAIVNNVNPTFYLKIPDIFDYENITTTMSQNPYIYINNSQVVTINGSKYIKIECTGTYNSSKLSNAEIIVNFRRILKDSSANATQRVELYMLTDNQNYYSQVSNSENLTQKETAPSNAFYASKSFAVQQVAVIQAKTSVTSKGKTYRPNSSDASANKTEKEFPLIVNKNSDVKFVGELNNIGKALTNVSLIYKLPVQGNKVPKEILNTTTNEYELLPILEEGYKFPAGNQFLARFASKLNNPVNASGEVNQLSRMINLKDIKVYNVSNAKKTELDPSRYTIYFTNDASATLNTDLAQFTAYDPANSDVTNATAILVTMNNVNRNENIKVEYTMTMPDEAGMVGTEFGAKYTQQGESTPTTLDSEPVYLINGNDNGSLKVIKTFEGYAQGTAPEGIDFSDIRFKLKDENGNYVQEGGVDVIVTVNGTGVAIFSNLAPGTYHLEEITDSSQIPGYNKISELINPVIEIAEETEQIAVNTKKRGTINIVKKFEDTNEIKGNATFQITRKTIDSESIGFSTQTVRTNDEGKASIVGLPYGEYTITETIGVPGYGKAVAQDITIDDTTVDENQEVESILTNPIGKGTIVINKTVPATQSVKELKFTINGIAMLSYINTVGDEVVLDKNINIDLNQDYSSTENVDVEISADELSATITLTNLPLGLYTITENIPNITINAGTENEKELKKYVDVTRTVDLNTDAQTETVNIVNRKKVGYLAINKTAFVDAGDELQEIGDKSQFKVRITGRSYYGTNVDKLVSLDEEGQAQTALEIGTYNIKEAQADGYDIYYGDSTTPDSKTEPQGINAEVEFDDDLNKGKITTANIKNILTGTGYVRIEKSLEGVTDPNVVKNAGIQFKIVGQNIAGGRVEELININQIDLTKNVAYGVSEGISVGGEYQLEEVSSTVPEFFVGMDPKTVTITTSATLADPYVIPVENKRGRGKLQMETKTEPEGGNLRGITYKVTEVKVNDNATYTKLDGTNGTENTVQTIAGDNGTLQPSFAEIADIKAGYYLVELDEIPSGYNKDQGQIIEVPTDGTGKAIFTITPNQYLKYTELKINKEVVNKNGNPASAEDYAKAGLTANQGFEVKLTNIVTNKEYFVYISENGTGKIKDLPGGTYTVEEQSKPKYIVEGYYNVASGIKTSRLDNNEAGKAIIGIQEGTSSSTNSKEITIVNKINVNTPPSGSTQADNLSKVKTEEIHVATQTIVYVLDEEGKGLPGVKFKLMKHVTRPVEGGGTETVLEQVNTGTDGNLLTTTGAKLLIRGLDVGKYTLVNVAVPAANENAPDGYLTAEDKQIVVYADVTQVSRIEIQKNVPRGSLRLATKYTVPTGNSVTSKYVPSSKYKIVDSETKQLVKFTRTATGDYKKSNLDDAVEEIVVKSGEVEVTGLEVGTYEIGLTGVSNGYALLKDAPEIVQLARNEEEVVTVEVKRPEIVKISGGYGNTMWLDKSGALWIIGNDYSHQYGAVAQMGSYNSIPYNIQFPEEDVIITDFDQSEYSVLAVDSKGRVWSWGSNSQSMVGNGTQLGESGTSNTPVCLSTLDISNLKESLSAEAEAFGGTDKWLSLKEAYDKGIKIVDVEASCYGKYLLDSNGKIWAWGYYENSIGAGNRENENMKYIPCCITDIKNSPLYNAYNEGIKIVKLANIEGQNYYEAGAIDSLGRAWIWGDKYLGDGSATGSYVPICISETESEFASAEIVDLALGKEHKIAVDKDGNVWCWGKNEYGELANNNTSEVILVPTKLSSDLFEGAKIKSAYTFSGSSSKATMFIDEYGKLWACGRNYYNKFSNIVSDYSTVYQPICISTQTDLKDVELKEITTVIYGGSEEIVALTTNGTLWGWGGSNYYGQIGGRNSYDIKEPFEIASTYTKHLEYNLRYKKVYCENANGSAFAIDENNKLWAMGTRRNSGLGNNYNSVNNFTQIPELVDEKVIRFTYYQNNMQIAVTDSGKVFVFGNSVANPFKPSSSSSVYVPMDITSKFNLEPGVKIVDGVAGYNTALFIDSLGRVWVAGTSNSYGQLGNGTTSNVNELTCISDDNGEILHDRNVKMKKIATYDDDATYILDEDGKVWFMGYNSCCALSYPLYYSNFGSNYTLKTPTCLTDVVGSTINQLFEEGIKVKDIECSYNGRICILFENGLVIGAYENQIATNIKELGWNYSGILLFENGGDCLYYDGSIKKTQSMFNMPEEITYFSKYSDSKAYCIDKYGQIWELAQTSSRNLAGKIKNSLYGIKMKRILGDGVVEADSDKGEIYVVNSEDSQFLMYGEKYIEELLGIEVVQVEEKVSTTLQNSFMVALDENGKIWTWGGNATYMLANNSDKDYLYPICISDIENTELYNAYSDSEHPNFKIVKIKLLDNFMLAQDNYGRIWTWGNNSNKQLGNGTETNTTINTPVCISKVDGDLKNRYSADFSFEQFICKDNGVYALDNNNELWTWGNTYTAKGTTTPVCLSKVEGSHLKNEAALDSNLTTEIFNAIKNNEDLILYNGKLWVVGCSAASNGNGEMGVGATGQVSDITCLNNIPNTELYNAGSTLRIEQLIKKENSYFALDSVGKIWSWGKSEIYESRIPDVGVECELVYQNQARHILGTGTTTNELRPVCICNKEGTDLKDKYNNPEFRINKIEFYDNYVVAATDNTGNIWVWGRNDYGELGNNTDEEVLQPFCITASITSGVKKIQYYSHTERYDRYNYYSYKWNNDSPTKSGPLYDYIHIMFILDNEGNLWSAGGNRGYKITHDDQWGTSHKNNAAYVLGDANNRLSLTKYTITGIDDFEVKNNKVIAYGQNKVYVWGDNVRKSLGISANNTEYYYALKSQDTGNSTWHYNGENTNPGTRQITLLRNMTIKKYVMDYNSLTILDTDGALWYAGLGWYDEQGTTLTKISNDGTTFIDWTDRNLLDSNGKVWGVNRNILYCQTDSEDYDAYGVYFDSLDRIKYTGYCRWVHSDSIDHYKDLELLKSRDGRYFSGSGEIYEYILVGKPGDPGEHETTQETGFTYYKGALAGKTVIDYSNNMAIDSEGNLYGWGSYDGIYDFNSADPICITTTEISRDSDFRTSGILANKPVANEIYGKKVEELYNDKIVKTTDGTYWYFPEEGNLININNNLNQHVNPLYGKEILKELGSGYIVASDNKIYDTTKEVPEYVMDYVDESEMQKVIFNMANKYLLALTNDGKIITCGSGAGGQLGNGSNKDITQACNISDLEGADLYNKYVANSSFEIVDIKAQGFQKGYAIVALDSEGKLWTWGYNSYGLLGNNTIKNSNTPICISNISDTDLANAYSEVGMKITEFDLIGSYFPDGYYAVALDNKGRVWRWGYNASYGQLGTGDNENLLTPKKIDGVEGVTKVLQSGTIKKGSYLANSSYSIIIDGNGKLWTAGNASSDSAVLANGETSGYSTFKCISDIDGTEFSTACNNPNENERIQLVSLATSYNRAIAIDNKGRLWTWGYSGTLGNSNKIESPTLIPGIEGMKSVCMSTNEEYEFGVCYNNGSYSIIIDTQGKVWTAGNAGSYAEMIANGTTTGYSEFTCLSNIENTELYNAYENGIRIVDFEKDADGRILPGKYRDSNNDLWMADSTTNYLRCYGKYMDMTIDEMCTSLGIVKKDEIIIDDTKYKSAFIILDTEGKLWSFGNNSKKLLGLTSEKNLTVPTCLSTSSESSLNGVGIESIKYEYGAILAIDTNGKVWTWGKNFKGILGDNVTEIQTNTYSYNAAAFRVSPTCICDVEGTAIKTAFDNNTALKIVKIEINTCSSSDVRVFALDNTGGLWAWGTVTGALSNNYSTVTNTPINVLTDIDGTGMKQAFAADATLKIIDISPSEAIDNKGNVWITYYYKYISSSYDAGIYDKAIFDDAESNLVISEIVSEFYVKDSDGNIWRRNREWSLYGVKTFVKAGAYFGNQLAEQSIKNIFANDFHIQLDEVLIVKKSEPQIYYAIDENGKLWVFDSSNIRVPKCISDTDATMHAKFEADENYKIEKLRIGGEQYSSSYNKVYCIDSDGKVWSLLYSPTADMTPNCISETEDELSQAYQNEGFRINEIYAGKYIDILLDSNGELWTRGYDMYSSTSYYRLGYNTGTNTTKTTEVFKHVDGVTSVVDIDFANFTTSDSSTLTVTDSNGKKWTWGNKQEPHFTGYASLDKLLEASKTGIEIAQILDENHFKGTDGNNYEISDNGAIKLVSVTYKAPEPPVYDTATIPGATVVKNTNYKAVDDEGNLYVWYKYLGGFKDFSPTSILSIKANDEEYIVEPEIYYGNGWSEVKANY